MVRFVVGLTTAPLPQRRTLAYTQEETPRTSTAIPTGKFASEVARHYGLPPELKGAGQCLGLLELNGGYRESDVQTYFQQLGIEPDLVQAGQNNPRQGLSDLEVTLDVELAAAICPQARIVIYNQNSKNYSMHESVVAVCHRHHRRGEQTLGAVAELVLRGEHQRLEVRGGSLRGPVHPRGAPGHHPVRLHG